VSIGAFIVDFYCHELRLIIEVDGWVHEEEYQKEYDERRQFWLEKRGYMIIRFLNDEVLFERDSVMELIKKKCMERHTR
jgi:very-short-patch-repair endonuclease